MEAFAPELLAAYTELRADQNGPYTTGDFTVVTSTVEQQQCARLIEKLIEANREARRERLTTDVLIKWGLLGRLAVLGHRKHAQMEMYACRAYKVQLRNWSLGLMLLQARRPCPTGRMARVLDSGFLRVSCRRASSGALPLRGPWRLCSAFCLLYIY